MAYQIAPDRSRSRVCSRDSLAKRLRSVLKKSLHQGLSATEYAINPSPIRSAIIDPGETSRINVAHFMADLATDDSIWLKWKGQMPVIYNKTSQKQ